MEVIGDAQTGAYSLSQHRLRERTYADMTLADIKRLAAEIFVPETAISAYIMPRDEAGTD